MEPPDRRLPSVRRAAASPSGIVAAGIGVAIGEGSHLGLAAALVLGGVGYAVRLSWAAIDRRRALRQRRQRRNARVAPWSVPEPWRGYLQRAEAASARIDRLASAPAPGPLADHLAVARLRISEAVEEVSALAASGAEVAVQADQAANVGQELARVQAAMRPGAPGAGGKSAEWLSEREATLAGELRELRRTQGVAARLASSVSTIVMEMEALVTATAELLASGLPAGELGDLNVRLQTLAGAMADARDAGSAAEGASRPFPGPGPGHPV